MIDSYTSYTSYTSQQATLSTIKSIFYYAKEALTSQGWKRDVRIQVAKTGEHQGRVISLEVESEPQTNDVRILGPLMPGIPNLHSHSFQRAIAGHTATQQIGSHDHFWTWREAMYRAALKLSPDQVEIIAAQCFLEQINSGYTSVAEFHYLHHDLSGTHYADLGELSKRVISAALRVGLPITLLPVLYRWSGVNETPPTLEQRRFILTVDDHARLIEETRATYRDDSRVQIGRAPHSLRAVSPQDLQELIKLHQAEGAHSPFHIHIAEQRAEVEMWLEVHQERPVEWLLNHAPVDERWCLVHATHVTSEEVKRLATSQAVVGICPTTEADLGDGIFPLQDFLQQHGKFGVGSDSNLRADPTEELRLLEWGQRLKHERRNLSFSWGVNDDTQIGERSLGLSLHLAALRGGAQAVGRKSGVEVGAWADWIVLNPHEVGLSGAQKHRWNDQWIFAGREIRPQEVYIAGERVVSEGKHPLTEEISQAYQRVVTDLNA